MPRAFTIIALAALTACGPNTRHVDLSRARDSLVAEMQRIAGPTALSCGLVALHEERATPFACAYLAESKGQSFWVAAQLRGIDSQVWRGIARGPDGNVWYITFDSDVSGGYSYAAKPRTTSVACRSVQISVDAAEPFSCDVTRP